MPTAGSNLGRNDANGGYAWTHYYTKGNIYKHKGGSNGFYTIYWPSQDGTLVSRPNTLSDGYYLLKRD